MMDDSCSLRRLVLIIRMCYQNVKIKKGELHFGQFLE